MNYNNQCEHITIICLSIYLNLSFIQLADGNITSNPFMDLCYSTHVIVPSIQ